MLYPVAKKKVISMDRVSFRFYFTHFYPISGKKNSIKKGVHVSFKPIPKSKSFQEKKNVDLM